MWLSQSAEVVSALAAERRRPPLRLGAGVSILRPSPSRGRLLGHRVLLVALAAGFSASAAPLAPALAAADLAREGRAGLLAAGLRSGFSAPEPFGERWSSTSTAVAEVRPASLDAHEALLAHVRAAVGDRDDVSRPPWPRRPSTAYMCGSMIVTSTLVARAEGNRLARARRVGSPRARRRSGRAEPLGAVKWKCCRLGPRARAARADWLPVNSEDTCGFMRTRKASTFRGRARQLAQPALELDGHRLL